MRARMCGRVAEGRRRFSSIPGSDKGDPPVSELRARLADDLKAAMRARDQVALSTIRMLNAALKNAEIAALHPLDAAEVQAVLVAQIKQRRDSIEQFAKAGRDDLVAQEQAELDLLIGYLPPPPGADAVDEAIREAIAANGATSAKDMGMVMRAVLDRYPGQLDGKQIAARVRDALAESR